MQGNAPRVHPTLPRFERVDLVYKSFNGTDFKAAVLVPKTVISSEHKTTSPLLVHFHGGGLIMGTPLDPEILSVWRATP
jgi:cephalosporin-C deacetylase-like acetyl esterase